MKLTFALPPRTVASALRGIAPHLPALRLIELSPLPVGTLEITRTGRQIQWQVAGEGVTF